MNLKSISEKVDLNGGPFSVMTIVAMDKCIKYSFHSIERLAEDTIMLLYLARERIFGKYISAQPRSRTVAVNVFSVLYL